MQTFRQSRCRPVREMECMSIFRLKARPVKSLLQPAIAGIMAHIKEMTAFLNPSGMSYKRFGKDKAPAYISWSAENRSQLIRVPAAGEPFRRAELRSPDSMANPFIAYGLIIYAALDGIVNKMPLPEPVDKNLYYGVGRKLPETERLPVSLKEAQGIAEKSKFIRKNICRTVYGWRIYKGKRKEA